MTHTFVFLGCGLDDPDIRLLLENHAFEHDCIVPHYFVLGDSEYLKAAKKSLEHNLGVVILPYDSRNSHELLPQAICELADLVDSERALISASSGW